MPVTQQLPSKLMRTTHKMRVTHDAADKYFNPMLSHGVKPVGGRGFGSEHG